MEWNGMDWNGNKSSWALHAHSVQLPVPRFIFVSRKSSVWSVVSVYIVGCGAECGEKLPVTAIVIPHMKVLVQNLTWRSIDIVGVERPPRLPPPPLLLPHEQQMDSVSSTVSTQTNYRQCMGMLAT